MNRKERLLQVLSDYHNELNLADTEVTFLNKVSDEERLLAYLRCIFSGITFAEVKAMEKKELSADDIAAEQARILSVLYGNRDKQEQALQDFQERIEMKMQQIRDIAERGQKNAEEAVKRQRQEAEESLKAKEEAALALQERVDILEARLRAIDQAASGKECGEAELPGGQGSGKRSLFFRRPKSQMDINEGNDTERYRRQRAFEEEQFRDRILRNPNLDIEQKRFLLSSFAEGISYWEIAQCAYPEIPVEFMKVMLKRQEKEKRAY